MSEAGDACDGAEPLPHRPAPHPDDRLWRHPSEMGHQAATSRRRRSRRRALVGGACAATCVAAGAVAHVLVAAPAGSRPAAVTVPAAALAPVLGDSVVRVVVSAGGSVVHGAGLVAGDDKTVVTAGRLVATVPTGGLVQVESASHGTVTAAVIGVDTATGVAVLRATAVVGRAAPVDTSVATISGLDLAAVATPADSGSVATTQVRAIDADDASTGPEPTGWLLAGDLDGWWGAPLLDSSGRVVAVVSTDSFGTALAVPAAAAVDVARQMVFTGRVVHGWVGLRLSVAGGHLVVAAVDEGGPAGAAGLRHGDVIVSLNGSPASDPAQLMATVRMARPGDVLVLGVLTGGRRVNTPVQVAEAPGG
ncbi:MAG TPA: S1C family serine protease [Acidimicrobiales bacterium]|nr:S1C family serine protease [Acidimicrobiales bacterium]